MKIGFLMGSFDPIHVGHVNMVRAALNSGLVDKVILVVSGHNPWKKEEPAPFDLRYQMAIAATLPFGSRCAVSNVENLFEPPYYSNKPLNYFREIYPDDERFIICGTDTVTKIPHWKNFETDIFPYYGIIEVNRDSSIKEGEVKERCIPLRLESGEKVDYVYKSIPIKALEISSTMIRDDIKNGRELFPLLTAEAIEIINKNNLYK